MNHTLATNWIKVIREDIHEQRSGEALPAAEARFLISYQHLNEHFIQHLKDTDKEVKLETSKGMH